MRRALVTGSAGFLGRHFAARLQRDGYEISRVDTADPVCPRDALTRFSFTAGRRFDLVIHCAAVAPHRSAIDGTPLTVGAGNLELDAAMFGWAARAMPGRVVYISSAAAYPRYLQDGKQPHPMAEDMVGEFAGVHGEPDAIYGWAKLTGERLADAYRAHGGAVTVVRPFSGYGEDQSAHFPFGAFRDRATRREDPFTIWGTGRQVRDWVHVDDIVAAALAAAELGMDGPLNICTGAGTSLRELAGMFCAQAGYAPAFEFKRDAPAGVAYRVGDPSRLREVYEPQVTLAEGVRRALKHATHVRSEQGVE